MAKTCGSCSFVVNDDVRFCEKCGHQFASDPKVNLPSDPQVPLRSIVHPLQANAPVIHCKTCDLGQLHLERVYRLSAPVVTIGYILLIPSVLGMLFSVFMLALFLLDSLGIPTAWMDPPAITFAFFWSALVCFLWIVAFFTGGLVGWLLVMKKKVLRCSNCGATVAAS
jgi:hypothetical protein